MKSQPLSKKAQSHQGGGCCCGSHSSNKNSVSDSTPVAASAAHAIQQRLKVEGATCGGCVNHIEQALRTVAGVTEAHMDLQSGIASVLGEAQINNLIAALKSAGYPATAA